MALKPSGALRTKENVSREGRAVKNAHLLTTIVFLQRGHDGMRSNEVVLSITVKDGFKHPGELGSCVVKKL